MTPIPLYDENGRQQSEIFLPVARLQYVKGRLSYSPTTRVWYKGAGCPYRCHFTNAPRQRDARVARTEVPYIDWQVIDPALAGKTGIFMTPYQPQFTDPIGGCGPKERRLLAHEKAFERSGVRVLEVYPIAETFAVYAVRYPANRRPFDGRSLLGRRLLRYMLEAGWNWPWDKNSVGDIDAHGRVTDVADLFRSREPGHQFGTVYSYLYSLYRANPAAYAEHARRHGSRVDLGALPYVAIAEMAECGVPTPPPDAPYRHLVREVLMAGRTCAHLENPDAGERAIAAYRARYDALCEVVTVQSGACSQLTPPISSASPDC